MTRAHSGARGGFPAILLAALLACCSPAAAQQMSPTIIDLPHTVDRIFAAADSRVLAHSSGQLELLDVVTGESLSAIRLETDLLSAVPVASQKGQIGAMMLLTGTVGAPAQVALLRLGWDWLELERSLGEVPLDFTRPAILPFGYEDTEVIVWNREISSYQFRLLRSGEWRDIYTKLPPYDLVGIGSESLVLGLHPVDGQVSLLNTEFGDLEDLIYVPGIDARGPGSLTVFGVGAASGGTGSVLIANQDAGKLTLLTVGSGSFQRLSEPLSVSVPSLTSSFSGIGGRALLAATDDLSVIVLGQANSDSVEVFEGSGRALNYLGSFSLGVAARDLVVLPGFGGWGGQTFAVLGADGRQLQTLWSDDIRLSVQDRPQVVDGPETIALTDGDIAGAQRLLAHLGYSIGAVDCRDGPSTQAAVRAFQFDRKLETTGVVDHETLALLNNALEKVGTSGRSAPAQADAYKLYMAGKAPQVHVSKLLYLGRPHQIPSGQCFGLNTLPPPLLWENSVPLAKLLEALDTEFSLQAKVVSAYRNPLYDACVGAAASSSHLSFAAMDLVPVEPSSRDGLVAALTSLSDRFGFKISTEVDAFIHVELLQRAVTRPTVHLQFAGGARSKAQQLSRLLSDDGFEMPGEERVAAAAGRREIRYFYEADRAAAVALEQGTTAALQSMGYAAVPAVKIVDLSNGKGDKPDQGTIELWVEL